jgi:hypothetical protein
MTVGEEFEGFISPRRFVCMDEWNYRLRVSVGLMEYEIIDGMIRSCCVGLRGMCILNHSL